MKTQCCLFAILLLALFSSCNGRPKDATPTDRMPQLRPAIAGATLPVNIAAPTFMIDEEANNYYTEIGRKGEEPLITVSSGSGAVVPDAGKWRRLLGEAAGGEIYVRVTLTRDDGKAEQMADVVCQVSADSIDSYLVYRLLYPGYELWKEIGIYQRCLENYDQEPVLENKDIDEQCVNCHSFVAGSPESMMLHVRGKQGGTILRRNGTTVKVNPKCPALKNGATYPSWHPSGRFIAFSANEIQQCFHAKGKKTIEVVDFSADMTLYDVERDETIAVPGLNGEECMETFPNWSPDGRMLYFCRAKGYKEGEALDSIRYDLCRIPFDASTRSFGEPETVFAASEQGKSVSFPRVSPDGRWLLFTLSDYGNFSIWHPESNLWLLDLGNGSMREVSEVNSEDVDSYHSWASGGRWIVFSSKRMDGLWARPYIAHFNPTTGRFGTPFVLPQSDPLFYDDFMKTYNIPEFATRKIDAIGDFVTAVKSQGE